MHFQYTRVYMYKYIIYFIYVTMRTILHNLSAYFQNWFIVHFRKSKKLFWGMVSFLCNRDTCD